MAVAYDNYRKARMRWLPLVPAHWNEQRAKTFYREVDERSRTGQEELLSVSHLTGVTPRSHKKVTMFKAATYVGSKLTRPGDIVINTLWAWMAALGASRHVGIVSPAYGVYRPLNADSFNPAYLDYLLRTHAYVSEYIGRSTGIRSSRLRLYPAQFLDISLLQPPKAEQDQIVAYLRAQDAHIAGFIKVKREIIALLQAHREAAIRAAVTPAARNGETPADRAHWFGSLPVNWQIKKLKHCVRFAGGGTPSKAVDSYWSGSIPWVSPKDMRSDRIVDSLDHISDQALRDTVVQLIPEGSILVVVRSGVLRRRIPVAVNVVKVTLNQDMKALIPGPDIEARFLKYLIEGYQSSLLLAWSKVGATVESLEHQYMANCLIPVPPITSQTSICDQLDVELREVTDAIEREKKAIALMLEYRDKQIAEVVTGQIDVRGWQPSPEDQITEEDLTALGDDDDNDTTEEETDGDDGHE